MRNEILLVKARPVLNLETTESTPIEAFQNSCLRPIAKMQHQLLLEVFLESIEKTKDKYLRLSPEQRAPWIADCILLDLQLRHVLLGLIIGQFTLEEYRFFRTQKPEITRRMLRLIMQRIQSAEAELYNRISNGLQMNI
ncbi:MAG: glyoxalase [Bacteroidetes bacterium]|nr:glyoxalase [Bacteroidota bacterium]